MIPTKIGFAESLWRETDFEARRVELCDGEADAIDRDRIADVTVTENRGTLANGQAPATAATLSCVELLNGFDDAHVLDLRVRLALNLLLDIADRRLRCL